MVQCEARGGASFISEVYLAIPETGLKDYGAAG